jgi:putative phosphoribosyl transferase
MNHGLMFKNRADAGLKLVQKLECYREQNPIILAMPRGGVVVAAEVARGLNAPLDVVVARKIGAPGQEEYAIGAVAEDVVLINEEVRQIYSPEDPVIKEIIAKEKKELARRIELYSPQGLPPVSGRVIIVVDDGIATGQSAKAALLALKKKNPLRLVLAVPVAPYDSVIALKSYCDEVICLSTPTNFYAVGQWYQDFSQVNDDQVLRILDEFRK